MKANSRSVLEHVDRLRKLQSLGLPPGIERLVHRNRLLKLAREGSQMTAADLARFAPTRRYATLVGVTIEAFATVTDELIETHDRIISKIFNKAKRAHAERFQETGRAVNDKVRLFGQIGQILVDAKLAGTDPFDAIDSAIGWDMFVASVAEAQHLAQPEDFDFLYLILESYASIRRYSPAFLDVLDFRSASTTTDLLAGVNLLRRLNRENLRKVPADAPTGFVKKRWHKLVVTPEGIDRRAYELCVLAELKNALRSGDIWVKGSRQFKDFDEPEIWDRARPDDLHTRDRYAPFHTKVVNVGVRDSTFVLDDLLYHESDLRIKEHYTDTAGFTDHVFGLMQLLGYRFAPRICDLGDTKH